MIFAQALSFIVFSAVVCALPFNDDAVHDFTVNLTNTGRTVFDRILARGEDYILSTQQGRDDLNLYGAMAWPLRGPSTDLINSFLHIEVAMLSQRDQKVLVSRNQALNLGAWSALVEQDVLPEQDRLDFDLWDQMSIENTQASLRKFGERGPIWHFRLFKFKKDPFLSQNIPASRPSPELLWMFFQRDAQVGYFVAPESSRVQPVTPQTVPNGIPFLSKDPPDSGDTSITSLARN